MPTHSHGHGHAHDPGHEHGHHHAHDPAHGPPASGSRALRWALLLTAGFFVAEVVGGVLANALALLADAGHMLTDAGALALSLFVAWFSRQPANPRKTYGYLRWEILAALINGSVLLLASGWILWEAVARLRAPEPVQGGLMLVIAIGGLVVNAISAWLLHAGAALNLNLRGAYLHVIGDLLGSVGAIIAALLISSFGWYIADPIASILMTGLIVVGAWRLVRESVDVLLEATPAHIDLVAVRSAMEGVDGVRTVHDLHVWTLTSGVIAMSAHAVVPDRVQHQGILEQLHRVVEQFGIQHVTIQLEGVALDLCDPNLAPLSPALR